MFHKQDLGKHIPDGKSAKDDFARMFVAWFIVFELSVFNLGSREGLVSVPDKSECGVYQASQETTLCLLLICVPRAE